MRSKMEGSLKADLKYFLGEKRRAAPLLEMLFNEKRHKSNADHNKLNTSSSFSNYQYRDVPYNPNEDSRFENLDS